MVIAPISLISAILLVHAHALTLSPRPEYTGDTVAPDFASFSIEFWCLPDYTGNTSHPNTFIQQILRNLKDVTGTSPAIRVGGTSADTTFFSASLDVPIILPPDSFGVFQPDNVTYGPAYFDYFRTFADDTTLTIGINLADNSSTHITNAGDEASAAISALGKSLAAIEIGNEPDLYIPTLRPSTYNQSDYVDEWLTISQHVHTDSLPDLPLQFGALARPPTDALGFQLETLLDFGITSDPRARVFSQHHYFFDNPGAEPQLATLMNHTHTANQIAPFLLTAADARTQGIKYIIGETSSASGGGRAGISDVFGAALWVLDYLLYAASSDVRQMFFHQHTNHTDVVKAYPYTAFQPVPIGGAGPSVRPMYYGILAFDAALGKGKSVINLSDDAHLPAYALYEGGRLDTVVVVNMNLHNATSTSLDGRSSQTVILALPNGAHSVTPRFLTAPGGDAQDNITFDGYAVRNTTGRLESVGEPAKPLHVSGGKYELAPKDSGAVVISISY
ncbi:hypothetical protein EVG20_g1417 [Dentipellis fragilis]|uniref:Beta-glucuronidase C-terminal domain-containing protein n=1 Tax=Dentipellis fragilis TaxID=205917 RepID=A0A4Y9ZBR4_9AGAM|nr:hypothetical protein EVG20_g1417 [Dentipellis fragilis]